MTQQELEEKYLRIPQEIKQTRRWVGYKIEMRDGNETKVPYNAINGMYARSNDPNTWTSFKTAILGCVKYGFAGIGFMLGAEPETGVHYLGVDLDNHAKNGEKPMNKEEFDIFCKEFIDVLDSYTEYSHSGEGIHIICKGTLPVGRRKKTSVEMYDSGRFFTMTGNVIKAQPIYDRTDEIAQLWEKYLKEEEDTIRPVATVSKSDGKLVFGENVRSVVETNRYLDDDQLLEVIRSSTNGYDFTRLFNGDMSAYQNDHSSADMALCQILAFWTGCDAIQMDRIFRRSGLMREKWDQKRSATNRRGIPLNGGTYGSQTIEYAIACQRDVYTPPKERVVVEIKRPETSHIVESPTEILQLDELGDPIVNIKKIFKNYPLNDTGNAERFYDYFGENFKYNTDNKGFMFWNGKTWTKDSKGFVRKYANKLINVLISEVKNTENRIQEVLKQGDEAKEDVDLLKNLLKAQLDNLKRVSNKAGKDAMLFELQTLHDLPVCNAEFDTQENLLNTESGVVDLYTGEIYPFDKKYKLSKNTNSSVSFDTPTVFLKFLHDILDRGNEEETQELINTVQLALGESATGRTNKENLFILYGHGSNGKSTFIKVTTDVFGDYGTSMNSDMLIQSQSSSSQSNEFSLSSLLGARIVSTSETAEGKKLDEVMIKQMLSGEKINAQFKYGQPFSFMPTFSPWMSTNNKPIIRATDYGTWRRIFFVPFLNTFKGDKKDVDMPKKLVAERAQILGWIIQGAVKLHNEYNDKIPKPKCLEEALSDYKKELDVIVAFLNDMCVPHPDMSIRTQELYKVYKDWCRDNGEYQYSERRFKAEMPKKGYEVKRDRNKGEVYVGLKLSTERKGLIFGEE